MPDYSKLAKGLTSLVKGAENTAPAVNRLDMNFKDVTKRIPELTDAANMVARGEMTGSQYDLLVRKLKPVAPYDFVPQPATSDDAMRALTENKRPMFGKTGEMSAGEQADLRLDIPAYKDHGVWVNSIHRKDQPTMYGATSSVKNATMIGAPDKALKVAQGGPKAPFAVIRGEWNPMDEAKAVKNAQKYLNHPDWKQVGYDPERHGFFYDRASMAPVVGADEVIQIGPLVLAKKPKYGKPEDFPFKKGGGTHMKTKQGVIRMQVGGLSALANLGKAGTLANKGSKGLDAARRAELLMHSGDNALPLVLPRARMSSDFIDQQADRVARQMLGEHVTSGKLGETSNLAGRSMKESQRVKGLNYRTTPTGTVAQETPYTPRKGDVKVAFPGDQTVSNKVLNEVEGFPIDSVQEGGAYYGLGQRHLLKPEFWKSTETPAKNVQGKVDRVAELYEPERVIGTHLAMGPMSNNFAMHFADANLRAIDWSKAKPKNINVFDNIIAGGYKDPKTGERVTFPNWPGMADREAALAAMKDDSNLRKWFNNRMKTPTLTEPLGLPNGLDIQYAVTEPRIRDMEINMTGLMTGKLKPDAKVEAAGNPHNTYSHRILGEAEGPQEVLTPFVIDFPDAAQHIASTKRPSDFTGTIQKVFPHQIVDDQYLNEYNQYRERIKKLTGQKDGGSIEAKPFHDFDQIMKRKDGGTVNSFEQRLKSAIDQHMAGGGIVERRYAEAGSVPAPTPQELEKMADAQGAAFGVFPQMASKRFQQPSPTMDRASELLKAQVTKEWEQAGEPGGAKGLALRIGAVLAGGVPDFVNFAQSMIPALNEEKPSFTTVLDSGKKPPAPYRDTREMQTSLKYPMSGTSTDIKNSMREKGMINEDEYPIAELLGSFAAPYALAKAPRAIEGGLNSVTAAARRPFTPATLTTEAVSPDLAKFKNPAFQDYATNQMIGEGSAVPMTTMGGRKTSQTRGQGVYLNEAKELEKNPMVGVNIPRAGNLATNKGLRADIATAGQELGQEAMAAHRFVPMATNQIKDASAMMIRGQGGRPLTSKEVMAMANELPDMIVTHSPANGGLMIAPFGMTKGQIPQEFLSAQSVARKVLGKDASIQFGKADPKKDLMYMMRNQYAEEGGRGTSQGAQDIRNKLKRMDTNFPLARQ